MWHHFWLLGQATKKFKGIKITIINAKDLIFLLLAVKEKIIFGLHIEL